MRPLNEREAANSKPGWRALPTYNAITQLDSKGEPVQGATYSMDNVFDTESNTKDLYSSVCMPVVANVVKGINGTIFAYGQTSSGKTFTMQGAQGADSGVLQLAAETIFAQIQATPDREFKLRASYLEIYNENLRDLLADGARFALIRQKKVGRKDYTNSGEIVVQSQRLQHLPPTRAAECVA